MGEDEYEEEGIGERLEEFGKVVYSYSSEWKSGKSRPWEDTSKVIQLEDEYYLSWNEGEINGPYLLLENAIRAGELQLITEETYEIESSVLDDNALQSLLVYKGILPHTLLINGRKWHSKAGQKVVPAT